MGANFEIKITKSKLVYEPNNDMVHNFYFLVNFRIINPQTRAFFRLRMIEWFDINDACEYYDKERVTDKEIKELANEYAYYSIDSHINDYYERTELYKFCNETINSYNRIVSL